MTAWLLSIVGITVIGVLVELLLTDSPMSKFVRSIYAFFILFVIVQPLPAMLSNFTAKTYDPVSIDTVFVNDTNARRIENVLAMAGYDNCVATFSNDKIYINAKNSAKFDKTEIISIVTGLMDVKSDRVEVIK
jgi:hypothetical protein